MKNNQILVKNHSFSDRQLNSSSILLDIVTFALENKNNPLKVKEILQIEEEGENIILILLKEKRFDLIQDLLTLETILCQDKILLSSSKALLDYLSKFANSDILIKFLHLFENHCDIELVREIFSYRDQDSRNSLMIFCNEGRNPEENFDLFINVMLNRLGQDFLYQELSYVNKEGNNLLLMIVQAKREKVLVKILSLLQSCITNEQKIKILCHTNQKGENILTLLAEGGLNLTIQLVINFFLSNLDNQILLFKVVERNFEGNNPIFLALVNQNQFLLEGLTQIISSAPDHSKILILSRLCSDQNNSHENFITLSFKTGCYDFYLTLMREVENNLEEEKILALVKKSFSQKSNLMHDVFMSHNYAAILSIIQYIKALQNLSPSEKIILERLILNKYQEDRSLLLTAITNNKIETVHLILDLVQELCNNLTHKLLLNSRDKYGNTAYALARNHPKILSKIEAFATDTGNKFYLELQEKEIQLFEKMQQSLISIISKQKGYLLGR